MFPVLVSRLRILVVTTFVVRILFSLVMPTMRFCVRSATVVRAARTVTLTERRCDEKQKCNKQRGKRSQPHDVPSSRIRMGRLLTNAAFPAFFGTVSTILAVLTRMARIGTSAGCRENIDLID